MRKDDSLTDASRFVALILRHKPSAIGITLDAHGWARVDELVAGVAKTRPFTKEMLVRIVEEDEKKRYAFNEDGSLIRANQGHSVDVDVELVECAPPAILYHGTAKKYIDAIERDGLLPRSRLYVHLSAEEATAEKVGKRHGEAVILLVDAAAMACDGHVFYRSANGVWLVKAVPTAYIKRKTEK